MDFDALKHLDDIGLVKFDARGDFAFVSDGRVLLDYYGTPVELTPGPDDEKSINVGKVLLTRVGQELAPISGSKPVDGFLDFVVKRWQEEGYAPFSPLPRPKK